MTWARVALGEVARVVGGATPRTDVPEYWDGDIPWATPKDLSRLRSSELGTTERQITAAGLRSCAAEVLPPGSVLLSSRAPIGYVAINTVPMATNQGFKSLVPDSARIDARFLYHWLRASRSTLEAMGVGATFKEISKATVARIEIPLPPLDEQRRIAAILNHVEHLRAANRRASCLLGTLPDVLYMRSFGDPRAAGVRSRSLTDVCHARSGATPSKSDPLLWEGEVPWFSPKDIKRDDLFESQDHVSAQVVGRGLRLFPKDTVVIVVRGMILAHTLPVATLRTPATINQDLKALVPAEPMPADFLAASIRVQRHHILAEVDTAAHGTKRLDARALEAIRIPSVTPAAMRAYLEDVERHRVQVKRSDRQLALSDALFISLQSRAFSGQL